MNEQLSMLLPPASRRSDPPSSKMADQEITESGQRESECGFVLWGLWTMQQPVTSRELAMRMGADRYMVAKRLPELRALGKAQSSGDRIRKCRVSGRKCMTWWAVDGRVSAVR